MQCVWSAKSLKQNYDIDHSMPFARWPNNDLWNLLPTDSKINNQKSDRLPTEYKLKKAKDLDIMIIDEKYFIEMLNN